MPHGLVRVRKGRACGGRTAVVQHPRAGSRASCCEMSRFPEGGRSLRKSPEDGSLLGSGSRSQDVCVGTCAGVRGDSP